MTSALIHHLVSADYYEAQPAAHPYRPEALEQDGFIHCTIEPETLLTIANAFYKNTPGPFVVLVIDPARVTAEVKYEPPLPPPPPDHPLARTLFPHIYGPLNRDAIVAVRAARRAEDGAFLSV